MIRSREWIGAKVMCIQWDVAFVGEFKEGRFANTAIQVGVQFYLGHLAELFHAVLDIVIVWCGDCHGVGEMVRYFGSRWLLLVLVGSLSTCCGHAIQRKALLARASINSVASSVFLLLRPLR
jgi:hypothetical protein